MPIEYTAPPATVAETAAETTTIDECTWKQILYAEGQAYADDIDQEFDDIYIADGPAPGP